MTDLIETIGEDAQADLKTKPVSKAAKALEKAAYDTDACQSTAFIDERTIQALTETLKELEARQELYRRVVGPKARVLLHNWKSFLAREERSFIDQNIHLLQDRKPPYLDLASIGGVLFFNRKAIEEALPALAFAVAGPDAMKQYKPEETYYPVVPRMIEIREELERLGAC